MEKRDQACRRQLGPSLLFLAFLFFNLLPAPLSAQTVDITEDQNLTVELGLGTSGPDSDGSGTATIYSGVTVNDSAGFEAVIVNENPDNDLWTVVNSGSLISEDSDSVYIYTSCTLVNYGTILSESLAGCAATRFGGAGFVLCCLRTFRRLLGTKPETVGYGGRSGHRPGCRGRCDRFYKRSVFSGQTGNFGHQRKYS